MDQVNPNQMPPITPSYSPLEPSKKSYGPLIAVVVILLVIVIGGLYFLGERMSRAPYTPVPQPESTEDNVTASLKSQGSSDDLDSIEKDLNSTDLDNLDQGAAALQAEIQ
jgi:hypothetical protein